MKKKYLTLRQIQMEELDILKYTIKFLEKNKINYYLFGGTLLGAVRHKGFIPWDDDIDIAIKRSEYDKLVNILSENKYISSNIHAEGYELRNGYYPFLKIVNENIIIEEKVKVDKHLWIDIFPLDNCPSDYEQAKQFLKRTFFKHQMISLKMMRFVDTFRSSKTLSKRIMKIIIRPFLFFMSKERYLKRYIAFCKQYNNEDTKLIANVVWNAYDREAFDKKLLKNKKYKFEDIEANSMEGAKEYLKLVYGNYMQLPPENKRYSHSFDAYKNN